MTETLANLSGITDPQLIISAAMDARNAGDAQAAIPFVEAALKRHPRQLRLWHVLGLLHRAEENSAEAVKAFRRAVKIDPTDPKVTHALARVTMEAGKPATALFDAAQPYSANDETLYMGRASAQLAEGHPQKAISGLEQLLRQAPNLPNVQELLANLHWMAGDRDRFAEGYENALKQDVKNQNIWFKYINSLVQTEQYEKVDAVVGRARTHIEAQRALDASEAIAASELGDCGRADRLFEGLAPYHEMPLAVRYVRHMLRTGRAEAAAEVAEKRTGDPDANEIWPYLAIAWRLLEDPRWEWLERDKRLVKRYDLNERIDMAALADHLRTLHVAKADMAGQSVRGGTQTDGPLFARADRQIRLLRAAIVDTIREHMELLGPPDPDHPVLRHRPGRVHFGGSWSVRLSGTGRHTNHIHPLGWYSSALYVSLPSQEMLGPPPSGWLALGKPPEELGLELPAFETVEPKIGHLTLFPSIMWHGTIPFDEGERLTVAFDVKAPVSR